MSFKQSIEIDADGNITNVNASVRVVNSELGQFNVLNTAVIPHLSVFSAATPQLTVGVNGTDNITWSVDTTDAIITYNNVNAISQSALHEWRSEDGTQLYAYAQMHGGTVPTLYATNARINNIYTDVFVTDLRVEDNTITLNDSGTDATALLSGFEIEGTAGIAKAAVIMNAAKTGWTLRPFNDYATTDLTLIPTVGTQTTLTTSVDCVIDQDLQQSAATSFTGITSTGVDAVININGTTNATLNFNGATGNYITSSDTLNITAGVFKSLILASNGGNGANIELSEGLAYIDTDLFRVSTEDGSVPLFNVSTAGLFATYPTTITSTTANQLNVKYSVAVGTSFTTDSSGDFTIIPTGGHTINTGTLSVTSTASQLKLAYDALTYTNFATNSSGQLSVTPTGNRINLNKYTYITDNAVGGDALLRFENTSAANGNWIQSDKNLNIRIDEDFAVLISTVGGGGIQLYKVNSYIDANVLHFRPDDGGDVNLKVTSTGLVVPTTKRINFIDTNTAGAAEGYISVLVNGSEKRIPYHAIA